MQPPRYTVFLVYLIAFPIGRRRGWSDDRAYGDRGAIAVGEWAVGKLPAQSDPEDEERCGAMVVAGARHGGRGAGRALASGLSGL